MTTYGVTETRTVEIVLWVTIIYWQWKSEKPKCAQCKIHIKKDKRKHQEGRKHAKIVKLYKESSFSPLACTNFCVITCNAFFRYHFSQQMLSQYLESLKFHSKENYELYDSYSWECNEKKYFFNHLNTVFQTWAHEPLLQENYPFGKLLTNIFQLSLAMFLFLGAQFEMFRVRFASLQTQSNEKTALCKYSWKHSTV